MVSTVADSGDEAGWAGLVDYSSDPATPRSTPQKSQSKQHTAAAETKAKGATLLEDGSSGKPSVIQAAKQATGLEKSARRSPDSAQPPERGSQRSKGHFPVMGTVTKKSVASLEKSAIPSLPPMETDPPPPKPGQVLRLDEAAVPSVSPTGAGALIAGSQAQLQPSAVVPAAQRKAAGKDANLQQSSVQPQPTGGHGSAEKKLPKRRRSEAEKLLEDSVAYASQNPLIDAKRQKLEAQESKRRELNAKGPSPTSKKRAVGSTKPVALATPASEQPDSQSVHPQSGLPESGPAAPISNPETITVAEVQKTQSLQQAKSQGSHASSAHTKSSNSGHVKGIKKRQKNTFSQRLLAAQPKPVSRPSRSTKTQVLHKEQNAPAGTQGCSQSRDLPTQAQPPIPSIQEPQAEQSSKPQPLMVPAPAEDLCPGPQQPVAAVQQLQDKPSAETERIPSPANADETATDAAEGEGDGDPPVAAGTAAAQPVCPPETQAIEPTEPMPVSDVSPVDLVQNLGEPELLSVPSDALNAAQTGLSPPAQAKQQAEIPVSPTLAPLTAAAQSELDSSKAVPEQQPVQTLVPSDQQQASKQAPQASETSDRQPSKRQPPFSPRQTQKPRQTPQKSRLTPQKAKSTPQKAQRRKAPEQEVQATSQQQQETGAKLDSPSSQPPSKRQRQEATGRYLGERQDFNDVGGLEERASSTMEVEAAQDRTVAVITQPEAIRPQRSSTEILQTVCTSQQQVPDFAALLPDGYEWDDYAKQHFSELLKQVWQTQFEVHAVRDAERAERQHYAAEKQTDDMRFASQLAESQLHLKAVDVETEKLQQSALALKKENEASQIHLQQMEDARMAVRQKALQQYLLTAQAMDMDFAASQAEHAALEGSNNALALTWH